MQLRTFVTLVVFCFATLSAQQPSSTGSPELKPDMNRRMIGPFRGGRTRAATGVPGQPNEFNRVPVAGITNIVRLSKELSASVFVVWSERNGWFAITWSDGGAIGNFHTRVFQVAEGKVTEAETVRNAHADFRSRHWCKTRGDNVQAYGWDENTGALVIVTSVYPTGTRNPIRSRV